MAPQHTKIVCTLGPASDKPRTLRRLIEAGVNLFRLNASHGTPAEHANRIVDVRRLARSLRTPVGIMVDLPGPKLRLGTLPDEKRLLRKGEIVVLTGPRSKIKGHLPVREDQIIKDLQRGDKVFLADGTVKLIVHRKNPQAVQCRVLVGGFVRTGSGVNLPDTDLAKALPTAVDRKWIRFALKHRVDWLAISFVQKVADVEAIRRLSGNKRGAPSLMAKIEKKGALRELEQVVSAADAVMVARGDLGVETPLEQVPLFQKEIIAVANRLGRPVVTATQMLESMVEHSVPTRAEISDVSNAILDGTDAVMLSAESAIGRYPVESVLTLGRVARVTEEHFPYAAPQNETAHNDQLPLADAIGRSAWQLAKDCRAKAILIDPKAKTLAAMISRFHPESLIFLLCNSWQEACRQTLTRSVRPLVVPSPWDRALRVIKREIRRHGGVKRGDRLVLVQSAKGLYGEGSDLLRIVQL
ncbi:MAG: Pyruvate kinase [Elusimicrobia bacterium]|nr:Pyruvate kinase [Elusimicrobiota bacterium]